ncbi:MAG: hypothetical protein FD129_2361, partial [bacterium]
GTSVLQAQETPADSAAAPEAIDLGEEDEVPPDVPGGDGLAGMGSLGISLGAMKYFSGSDLSDGSARPIFHAQFKYVWNERLVSILDGGWGWNSYGEGGGYDGPDTLGTLAVATPVTLGLDYRFQTSKPSIVPRVGAGVGLYLLSIRAGRSNSSRDPITDQKRKSTSFGFYGKVGAEFMLKPTFWLNTDLIAHEILSADAESYPSGWLDENAGFIEIRVGLNHYFGIRGDGAAVQSGAEEEEEE